jgi:N-acetylglucosaminyl-diphospho-decaprenol L-rhamnosyltransferase
LSSERGDPGAGPRSAAPATNPAPVLAIVVVTWNSRPELPTLVDSACRHLHVAYRWIFVDNASEDDTVAWLREHVPNARIIELKENQGFGAGCNAGVAASDEDVVVLLNPDTELIDGSLEALAELALTTGSLCGPRLLNGDGTIQPSASPRPAGLESLLLVVWPGRLMPDRLRARCEPWRLSRTVRVGWLTGACIAASREVLGALGPFDERLHHYAEDLDLALRATACGVTSIFAPDVARVIHHGGLSAARHYADAGTRQRTLSRRWVVRERLGSVRAAYDEGARVLFLATRFVGKRLLGRDAERERAWLRAVRR